MNGASPASRYDRVMKKTRPPKIQLEQKVMRIVPRTHRNMNPGAEPDCKEMLRSASRGPESWFFAGAPGNGGTGLT
jgi:hypothetical protein